MKIIKLCKAIENQLFFTKAGFRCSRNPSKTGYCSQHDQNQRILMLKKELKKMHQRVRIFSEKSNELLVKLYDIEKIDFIKFKLSQLDSFRSYRAIVADIRFKEELEELFDLPFDEIEKAYLSMIERRNKIVHKYTKKGWSGQKIPKQIKDITRKTRKGWVNK